MHLPPCIGCDVSFYLQPVAAVHVGNLAHCQAANHQVALLRCCHLLMNRRLELVPASLMAADIHFGVPGPHIHLYKAGSNRLMPPLTTPMPNLLQRASTLVRGSGAQTATIPSTPSWRRCWSCSQSSTRRLCACLLQWPVARWLLVTPLCRASCLAHFLASIPGACWAVHRPPDTQLPVAAVLTFLTALMRRSWIFNKTSVMRVHLQPSCRAAGPRRPCQGCSLQGWTDTNALSAAKALQNRDSRD